MSDDAKMTFTYADGTTYNILFAHTPTPDLQRLAAAIVDGGVKSVEVEGRRPLFERVTYTTKKQ